MYSSKICFVLPAKNEESTLELIIKKINNIAEKIDTSSVNIIVASDSHDKTDEICNRFDNVILVEDINSSVIEFKLMTLANNFIIANSTFSLWASLLSNLANNSIKIAPKEILTFGDVIPNNYKIY